MVIVPVAHCSVNLRWLGRIVLMIFRLFSDLPCIHPLTRKPEIGLPFSPRLRWSAVQLANFANGYRFLTGEIDPHCDCGNSWWFIGGVQRNRLASQHRHLPRKTEILTQSGHSVQNIALITTHCSIVVVAIVPTYRQQRICLSSEHDFWFSTNIVVIAQ